MKANLQFIDRPKIPINMYIYHQHSLNREVTQLRAGSMRQHALSYESL